MAVALVAQAGGTLLILALAFPTVEVTASALAWCALSGGVAYLYRAMGAGQFSVVVPLRDVAAEGRTGRWPRSRHGFPTAA